MACEYCEIIQGKKKAAKIYEDSKVVAFLATQPAAIGHVVVAPKKHSPIFEAVDDEDVRHLFRVANKLSIAVFEAIKCEGTNLIVSNGIEAGQEAPHFSVNIIARKSGDGLSFDWPTKQLKEEEMATVEMQLKDAIENPAVDDAKGKSAEAAGEERTGDEAGGAEPGEEGTGTAGSEEGSKEESAEPEEEENYLIKQLKRVP
jgi:histidine triad (HIT) family protein